MGKIRRGKKRVLRNHRKVFRHFLSWCVAKGYINGVPELPIPKHVPEQGFALTPEQIISLCEKIQTPKLMAFVLMYLFMAMRSREITALEWKRVYFDKRVIYLGDEHVKTRRGRWIPMHPQVYDLLLKLKETSKSPFVFPMRGDLRKPTCNTGMYKAFETAKTKAGLPKKISPHDLRHTWNTEAHADPTFTDSHREQFAGSRTLVQKSIYVHTKVENLRSLVEAVKVDGIDDLLKKKQKSWGV